MFVQSGSDRQGNGYFVVKMYVLTVHDILGETKKCCHFYHHRYSELSVFLTVDIHFTHSSE